MLRKTKTTTTKSTATITTTTNSTHRNSGQQSLGHVGDDNADKEDDGIEPVVAEDERDDEERDSECHRDRGNNVNKVGNFASYRRLSHLEATRQVGNPTHHRPVTGVDYQTSSSAYRTTVNVGLLSSTTTAVAVSTSRTGIKNVKHVTTSTRA